MIKILAPFSDPCLSQAQDLVQTARRIITIQQADVPEKAAAVISKRAKRFGIERNYSALNTFALSTCRIQA